MNSSKKSFLKNEKARLTALYAIGVCLLIASFFLNIFFGSAFLSLADLLRSDILAFVRLPRVLACFLSGAALGVSGAVLQRVLSNKLASPGIIGVNAGAGLGVTICCAAGLLSGFAISIAAFAGSLLAVTVISLAAYKFGASRATVILGGVAVNSILNAVSECITALSPDISVMSLDFRMGSFSAVYYNRLFPAALLILASLALVFSLYNELDILTLGDETASGLGMKVKHTKTLFLVLAALLAGASVSYAGLLGFVGLIVPHIVRKGTKLLGIRSNNSRNILFLCALYGACLVSLCDFASRMIFSPFEMPVGVVMSMLGGPFFIALLLTEKGGAKHD